MKYLRIVLAVEEKDLAEFVDEILEIFIESDTAEGIDGSAANPIQGAYVSEPYDSREEALHLPTFIGKDQSDGQTRATARPSATTDRDCHSGS
jgi:hypothetical protein